MSLLIINGANRISQGLIRTLQGSNKYERIVSADVFPNYRATERFLHFKDTLRVSLTQLTEAKFTEKSDLEALIRKASHVIYVTHDYYLNVPSKLSLLKHTASLSKAAGVKKVLAVLPVENDHQGEENALQAVTDSIADATQILPELSVLRTDLTFGHDSNAVQQILARIANDRSLCFKPSSATVSPVHTLNVAKAAAKILEGANGQNVLAQGAESFQWNQIVERLSTALNKQAILNQNTLESVVSPLGNNVFSQTFHCAEYLNLAQFIHQYVNPKNSAVNAATVESLGVKDLVSFSEFYKQGSLNAQDFAPRTGSCSLAYCI